jgi:hypothetical protein
VTGWAFREIMEDIPIAAGLQIIDADLFSKGINRMWTSGGSCFDSATVIDEAFKNLIKR